MNTDKLLQLCKSFRDLGDAVGNQLYSVAVYGEDAIGQNSSAMKMALEFLDKAHRAGIDDAQEIADCIREQLK